ncbi:MAG: hypothetical protein ACE5RG_10520, partial [Candidatus Nitrosomaritimum yanchengensis]
MAKKLGAPIALGVVTVLAILLLTSSNNVDEDILKSTCSINAVYFPSTGDLNDGYIQINFQD